MSIPHHRGLRIVLDMQACQTTTKNRGIGRYSLALTRAALASGHQHHWYLVADKTSKKTGDELADTLDRLMPAHRLITIAVPENPAFTTTRDGPFAELEQRLWTRGYTLLNPDVLHIHSLLDAYVVFPHRIQDLAPVTSATVYDLIPLLFPDHYLQEEPAHRWYYERLSTLKQFDILLAISEATRKDVIEHLDISPDRIVNIGGAVDPRFRQTELHAQDVQALRARYRLARPFVMYTCATDFRKNIERTIAAYAALPVSLRQRYCLALVCQLPLGEKARLRRLASRLGLSSDDLVLTGFVPDEDLVALYNCCHGFIFPSLYEGFGLPVLEAMACGAPVLAANNSSLTEIVGRTDALFNAGSVESISQAIYRLLTDNDFRRALSQHGLEQAKQYTWQRSAKIALEAWEESYARKAGRDPTIVAPALPRRRMAYLSPLPPEQSGIAAYSAQLLPELATYLDIDLFTTVERVEDPWLTANFRIYPVAQFPSRAAEYEIILYQFGNSPFHTHMLQWLPQWPGIVVLHDFFLSNLIHYLDGTGFLPGELMQAALRSHGVRAAALAADQATREELIREFPLNGRILEHARGLIVHSQSVFELLDRYYPEGIHERMVLIPQLRRLPIVSSTAEHQEIRRRLGISEKAYLICTFGHITATKCADTLLKGFELYLELTNVGAILVFIGELDGGEWGAGFRHYHQNSAWRDRVKVTGFVASEVYQDYLKIADVAVQLRTNTRGETSRAVLDCLAYDVPTVINDYAGFKDYPDDVVYKLPEQPDEQMIAEALTVLLRAPERRKSLAQSGRNWVAHAHDPSRVAAQYRVAIESFHNRAAVFDDKPLAKAVAAAYSGGLIGNGAAKLLEEVDKILDSEPRVRVPRIYIDISAYLKQWQEGYITGIQRVVGCVSYEMVHGLELVYNPFPVRLTGDPEKSHTEAILIGQEGRLTPTGTYLSLQHGDIYLLLDWAPDYVDRYAVSFQRLHRAGVRLFVVIYDTLPYRLPEYFPEWLSKLCEGYIEHLIELADGIICISQTVADDLIQYIQENNLHVRRVRPLKIGHFHLGADFIDVGRTVTVSPSIASFFQDPAESVFLMVGTIEPRKGHAFVLEAFEALWAKGSPAKLCVVGRVGWMVEDIARCLNTHPELGHRLLFLEAASDDTLVYCYQHAAALIHASAGEGFGLPLIEAAQYGLPILATDIPVFREVCGDHALYFSRSSYHSLVACIERFLELQAMGKAPDSHRVPILTWRQSTAQLMQIIQENQWDVNVTRDGVEYYRFGGLLQENDAVDKMSSMEAFDGFRGHKIAS